MVDQLERLTNLVALLLETRRPLTLKQIADALSGQYPPGEEARRAAFERDKKILRSVGIPLRSEVLSGTDVAGSTGYHIPRADYELDDLGLSDQERRALQVAVATMHLGADWAEDAIAKLGGAVPATAGVWAGTLDGSERLAELYEAVSQRRRLTFRYRGTPRLFEPWGLVARQGWWYVLGRDTASDTQRTFRVDRIESAVDTVGPPGCYEVPDGFDPRQALSEAIAHLGDPGDGTASPVTEALVAVDADRARLVEFDLGAAAVRERRADGSLVVAVGCTNRAVFRTWLLGLVDHAEVIGPPEVRAEIVAWLEAMVRRG